MLETASQLSKSQAWCPAASDTQMRNIVQQGILVASFKSRAIVNFESYDLIGYNTIVMSQQCLFD